MVVFCGKPYPSSLTLITIEIRFPCNLINLIFRKIRLIRLGSGAVGQLLRSKKGWLRFSFFEMIITHTKRYKPFFFSFHIGLQPERGYLLQNKNNHGLLNYQQISFR